MVQAGPQGAARIVEHTYVYVVSDQFIEDRIDLEGVELPREWAITFALQDLPDPGARARARALRSIYDDIGRVPELDEPTDDPVEFLDRLEEWLSVEQERVIYERRQQGQAEQIREAELRSFDQEMDTWIESNGSPRLKMARSRNYKATSGYARERGRAELPQCWIDTAGVAEYRERVDPSTEALTLETEYENFLSRNGRNLRIRIVWLVEPPAGLAEMYEGIDVDQVLAGQPWEFEQQETLLVTDFLGRYEAFMPVDSEVRAPVSVEGEGD